MNLDDINESTFYTAEFVDNERVMVNVIWKDPLTLEQKNNRRWLFSKTERNSF